MERLTHRRESDNASCLNGMTTRNDLEVVQKAVGLLCRYEETGLTPEEINAQHYLVHRYSEATDGLGLKRLEEINQAEKDGRLVVLPCKVGDKVWVIMGDGEVHPFVVRGISMSATCDDTILRFSDFFLWGSGIGNTWFLTRQEAEEALRKEADNG